MSLPPTCPPIQYGNLEKDGFEVKFQGEWSLLRKRPYYVFRSATSPCFPTTWRFAEDRGTPETREAVERKHEARILAAWPSAPIVTITKKAGGYWASFKPFPSDPQTPPEQEEVVPVDLLHIMLLEWLKTQSLEQTRPNLASSVMVSDSEGKSILERLAATEDGWRQCSDFMISQPSWWAMLDALKAEEIMNRAAPGVALPNDWLARVMLAEINKGVTLDQIRNIAGDKFAANETALLKCMRAEQQHRPSESNKQASLQKSLFMATQLGKGFTPEQSKSH